MKTQKIRGHKRIHSNIVRWHNNNLSVDLKQSLINNNNRYYTKIMVYPWNSLSINGRVFPEPSGKTKKLILFALLDIYEKWKGQLDSLNEPYYLKIWLFEPRFSKSQVVCAVDDAIDFYNNVFFIPGHDKRLNLSMYGFLAYKMKNYNWDYCLDEDYYDNSFVGSRTDYSSLQDYYNMEKLFKQMLKKPHRKELLKEPFDNISEIYSFQMGDIWIGSVN